jgi:carboxymethylenebutenolidase
MADDLPFTNRRAGEAFLVDPPGGTHGPGVMVLHSWWGLNRWARGFCRRLAAEGYTVLAPDMFDGVQPMTEAEGEAVLAGVDPDELSGLVMSSAHTLRAVSIDPDRPIAVVGFSMGASLALWISARLGSAINAAVAFYGAQSIDFDEASATYQGHFAENDHIVSEEDRVVTESFIRLGGRSTEFHVYPDTGHWFFEEGKSYDPRAAELAWDRTVDFLARQAKAAC